ncbi:MAG: LptF/LptG family permease [Alphaproteobacteria bacterium]|nr:LptF/LptG family permease [Alphaproteobacteria bacterium]
MKLSYTLSIYLSKFFFQRFMIFLSTLSGIILLFDFSELLRRVSSKPDIHMGIVTQMALLRLPQLCEQLLPFIVFFTAMFSLWRLSRYNEISVVRAAGISVWQMLFPFIASALFIGFLDVGVINPIAAKMMEGYEFLNKIHFHGEKGGVSISEGGIWVRQITKTGPIVLRISRIDVSKKQLSNVMILEYKADDAFQRRIDAKCGTLIKEGLELEQVWISQVDEPPKKLVSLFYPVNITVSSFQENNKTPAHLSFWSLLQYSQLMEKSGLSGLKYRLYWHSLIARAFWLVAMIFIATIFSLRSPRDGGKTFLIVSGAAVGFILYIIRDITYAMGQSSVLPTLLAAWAPTAISAMLGVAILLHLEDG